MASVLINNKNDISKVIFFLQECKCMGLSVFGLSVNELVVDFLVDKSGNICFGLIVLCGVGEGLVEVIVEEWDENGKFESIFDMMC